MELPLTSKSQAGFFRNTPPNDFDSFEVLDYLSSDEMENSVEEEAPTTKNQELWEITPQLPVTPATTSSTSNPSQGQPLRPETGEAPKPETEVGDESGHVPVAAANGGGAEPRAPPATNGIAAAGPETAEASQLPDATATGRVGAEFGEGPRSDGKPEVPPRKLDQPSPAANGIEAEAGEVPKDEGRGIEEQTPLPVTASEIEAIFGEVPEIRRFDMDEEFGSSVAASLQTTINFYDVELLIDENEKLKTYIALMIQHLKAQYEESIIKREEEVRTVLDRYKSELVQTMNSIAKLQQDARRNAEEVDKYKQIKELQDEQILALKQRLHEDRDARQVLELEEKYLEVCEAKLQVSDLERAVEGLEAQKAMAMEDVSKCEIQMRGLKRAVEALELEKKEALEEVQKLKDEAMDKKGAEEEELKTVLAEQDGLRARIRALEEEVIGKDRDLQRVMEEMSKMELAATQAKAEEPAVEESAVAGSSRQTNVIFECPKCLKHCRNYPELETHVYVCLELDDSH